MTAGPQCDRLSASSPQLEVSSAFGNQDFDRALCAESTCNRSADVGSGVMAHGMSPCLSRVAFLQKNQLFTMPLTYIFPSGQNGLDTTFERLAADFPSDSYAFAKLSDDTRQTLKAIFQQIELALGR